MTDDATPAPSGGDEGGAETSDAAEDRAIRQRAQEARSGFGARFGAAGLPVDKSANFNDSAKRLLATMGPEARGAARSSTPRA